MSEFQSFPAPTDDRPEVPWPLDCPEVGETIQRLYTQDLKETGVSGTVLVSVTVDERGSVVDARAVRPEPLVPDGNVTEIIVTEILQGPDGNTWRPPPFSDDSRLQRIAEEAARAQRFRPASHDGTPVRFDDFRMSFILGR